MKSTPLAQPTIFLLPFRYSFHLVLMLAGLLWASAVSAKTFNVNTEADVTDAAPGDGVCATANGQCSLRAATQEANLTTETDTIILDGATYPITITSTSELPNLDGDFDITQNLLIQGKGSGKTIIDAKKLDRLFEIQNKSILTITGVTLQNGVADYYGGAIYVDNFSTLNIAECVITGNSANTGGGIFTAAGVINIDNCAIRNNTASVEGGAISSLSFGTTIMRNSSITQNQAPLGGGLMNGMRSDTTIIGSTIDNNVAENGGGILMKFGRGVVRLLNTTLSGNRATNSGGGIYGEPVSYNTLELSNSTITNNAAGAGNGGGIFNGLGSVTTRNSIIATNLSPLSPDCNGALVSQSHNLIGNNTGCAFVPNTDDQLGTPTTPINPLLGPLTNNGGPTLTHALLPNSPAIDAGNPLTPGRGSGACEPTDQRGEPRASHGPCDIGAFEATGGGDAWLSAVITPNTQPNRQRVQYQLTVGNAGPQRVRQLTLTLTPPRHSPQTSVTGAGWVCTAADNTYTCQRESLNTEAQSILTVQLTPPPNTKEITLEAHIETVSQDPTPTNNHATLTTVINRPPRVLTPGLARYDIHGKPVPLAPNLSIEDEDDTRLKSATVRFSQGYRHREDRLTAPNTTTLTAHWQADQSTLTLTGDDTLSAYEQTLRQVRYDNTNANPTRHPRLLEISVSDTYADSDPAPLELEITGETLASIKNNSGIVNPFVSDTVTAGGDTPQRHARVDPALPLEDAEPAAKGKPAGREGREKHRDNEHDATLWQSVRSMKYDDEWVNLKKTSPEQTGAMTNVAIVAAGAIFLAGFVHLYVQSGGLIGLLFSFPFWGSIDPIPVILLSKKEQKRREKRAKEDRKKENSDRRIGTLLDDG